MATQTVRHRKGYEPRRFAIAVTDTIAAELRRFEEFAQMRARDDALLILSEVRNIPGITLTWPAICLILNAHFGCGIRETDVKRTLDQARRRKTLPSPATFFCEAETNGNTS